MLIKLSALTKALLNNKQSESNVEYTILGKEPASLSAQLPS